MKTFLIVYTINDEPNGLKIYNSRLIATSIADAYEQATIKLGDKIVIINIIEL